MIKKVFFLKKIKNVRSCILKLSLKHLVHVHKTTKNLFGVSKFVQDNNVFFEFHSYSYFNKDLVSKIVLLEGKLKNSLYVFD